MTDVELIKQYYGAFNQKNYGKMLEMVSEEVAHFINEGQVEVGREKFAAFLKMMDTYYEEQVLNLEVFAGESGGRVAAEFDIQGTYKVTCQGLPEARSQKYFLPVGAFFGIEDGQITRITNYYNLQDWISQVS